ncbi:MAG: hypothetical protein DWH82_12985 [Planctomycetota bacterium]|nr:MAG: hypothetical protein DWH82_12985 [Planctomycetota bacterium]
MHEDTVDDIVAQIETGRAAGCEPDMATLCGGDAPLMAMVGEQLRILDQVGRLMQAGQTDDGATREETRQKPPTEPPIRLPPGFECLGILGQGGMGMVYKARDKLGSMVAIKTLTYLDPARLIYLKREFTLLENIRHDNLVRIYGQIAEGSDWFCLMEYVDGRHLLDFIDFNPDRPHAHLKRVRSAFIQLARAIQALHLANRVHRDIKSANILVTQADCVKLIDFGLIVEIDDTADRQSGIVGTMDYMAPELFEETPVTPKSDWYSFGVLLYEALCGCPPFPRPLAAALRAKKAGLMSLPAEKVPGIPVDLAELCVALLHPDPTSRPGGTEVLTRLGGGDEPARRAQPPHAPLVGRTRELQFLKDAAADVHRLDKPILVVLSGRTGIGKTTLVNEFLRTAGNPAAMEADQGVILRGKCYEHCSVPYNALDSVVDSLLGHLRSLKPQALATVLPARMTDLTRLFPVLGKLELTSKATPRLCDGDPHEARRCGSRALRELFQRLACHGPLVVFADDIHWGDGESAMLLEELVRPPDPPAVLFLFAHRQDKPDDGPFLKALAALPIERRDLALAPLDENEIRQLVQTLLCPPNGEPDPLAEVIVHESFGNPLLAHELLDHRARDSESTIPPTIESLVRGRLSRLEPQDRWLVEAIAFSPGPVDIRTACLAAEIPAEARRESLDRLTSSHLIRTLAREGMQSAAEPFHDRVRSIVIATTPPEKGRRLHSRLAEALIAAGSDKFEVLAHHHEHGGATSEAIDFYFRAGVRSADALAFDRASEQHRCALTLCAPTDPRRKDLTLARADSLANCARAVEASQLYLEAATLVTGPEALFCRQRAAEQLIRWGRMEEGFDILREVLATAGISLPKAGKSLNRSMRWLRFRLWLRGTRFRAQSAGKISANTHLRSEICRWAASLVRMFDLPLATWFHTLGLIESWSAGDPFGAAFALGREMYTSGGLGGPPAKRIGDIYVRAVEIAGMIENPADRTFTEAMLRMYRGISLYLIAGEAGQSIQEVAPVREGFSRCSGPSLPFQRMTLRMVEGFCLLELGELAQFRVLIDESTQGMLEKGNLHAAVTLPLLSRAHQLDLAEDLPDQARIRVRQAIGMWSQSRFFLQHFWAWWGETEIHLYEGNHAEAYRLGSEWLPHTKDTSYFDNLTQSFAFWTEGRILVGRAVDFAGGERTLQLPLMARARKIGHRLTRLHAPAAAAAFGWSLLAACHHLDGHNEKAINLLEKAGESFDRLGMALHLAATRIRRGSLQDSPAGNDIFLRGKEDLQNRGVKNCLKFANIHQPGFSNHLAMTRK